MRQIVAATDFSAWSHLAIDRAAQLARAHSAQLHALHVSAQGRWSQDSGVLGPYLGSGNDQSVEDAREHLATLMTGPARRFRIRPECHVLPGKPADEIAAFAAAREADLVVLGTRGEGRLGSRAVGGTALKVLWQSLLPVLLVRQPADAAYRRVLVATDLSERSQHVLDTALRILPKASFTLLHAFRGEHETTLQLVGAPADVQQQYVADAGTAAATLLERLADEAEQGQADAGGARRRIARVLAHSHPVPAVLKAASELKPDLVVLGRHAGPRWQERMLGSVVQNLLQQLRTDVLVVA